MYLAKNTIEVLRNACLSLVLLAFLLYKLVESSIYALIQQAMYYIYRRNRPQTHPSYSVVATLPKNPKVNRTKFIIGLLTLLVLTNGVTYFTSDAFRGKSTFVETVKKESLFLIDHAAQHIADVTAFEGKVRRVSKQLNVPPEWLMAVMYTESKFNPSIENLKGSGAIGLIQFTVPAVKDLNRQLGTRYYMSDIKRMTAHQQMDLVWAYLKVVQERYGQFKTLPDLYLAVLYPRAIGQDKSYALFARPTRAYRQNSGLDENKDGVITVGDIHGRMERMFPTAYIAGR